MVIPLCPGRVGGSPEVSESPSDPPLNPAARRRSPPDLHQAEPGAEPWLPSALRLPALDSHHPAAPTAPQLRLAFGLSAERDLISACPPGKIIHPVSHRWASEKPAVALDQQRELQSIARGAAAPRSLSVCCAVHTQAKRRLSGRFGKLRTVRRSLEEEIASPWTFLEDLKKEGLLLFTSTTQ